MKLPRVLLLLLAASLLSGCYTIFRSTNLRGETIAEWTAKGPYYRVAAGYRINAIERVSGPPYPQVSRYPHGRKTTVSGPVIEHWRTTRPAWLDDEITVTETELEISEK